MSTLRLTLLAGTLLATFGASTNAFAVSPRNPYRTFNLSGINYGSMRWEQAQRQGRRVWPYYNSPTRSTSRSTNTSANGVIVGGGGISTFSTGKRTVRSSRRRR